MVVRTPRTPFANVYIICSKEYIKRVNELYTYICKTTSEPSETYSDELCIPANSLILSGSVSSIRDSTTSKISRRQSVDVLVYRALPPGMGNGGSISEGNLAGLIEKGALFCGIGSSFGVSSEETGSGCAAGSGLAFLLAANRGNCFKS